MMLITITLYNIAFHRLVLAELDINQFTLTPENCEILKRDRDRQFCDILIKYDTSHKEIEV